MIPTDAAPPWGTTVAGNAWDEALDPAAGPRAPRRTVSVVVTHFEQPRELARTLAALARQTRPPLEVVVADDGSAVAPTVPDGVRLVRQPDLGFRAAAARNLGAAHARGELLVFLDADTVPEPGFVAALCAPLDVLPELLAVGRRHHAEFGPDPADATPVRVLPDPEWLQHGYTQTADLRHADVRSYRFVISAVMACSRWWFGTVGGFDAGFDAYGGEDWELAHRSWLAGGLVAHVPRAVAWHDGPAAGTGGRGAAGDPPTVETLAVAHRVAAPGAAFRGLLGSPPDLLVTLADGWSRRETVLTVDSLLAAVPHARVVARRLGVEDPRVSGTGRPTPAHRLHLRLLEPVLGDVAAWRDLVTCLDGADPPATVHLRADDGRRIGLLDDLRQHRRAARWEPGRVPLPRADHVARLRPVGETSLEAWLGGWA